MKNIKIPKKLFEALEQKNLVHCAKILNNKDLSLNRITISEAIIDLFGFEQFASLILKNNYLINKKEYVKGALLSSCKGNLEAQEYCMQNNIQFNAESLPYIVQILDRDDNNYLNRIKYNQQNLETIFTEAKDSQIHPHYYLYKRKYAQKLNEVLGINFDQQFKDNSLYFSSTNLDGNSCQYWLDNGADIYLKSIQHQQTTPFWVFNSRNLIYFHPNGIYAGQEHTFSTLLSYCSSKDLKAENPLWEKTIQIIISQQNNFKSRGTIQMIFEHGSDIKSKWFQNENEAAKLICILSPEISIKLLNSLYEEPNSSLNKDNLVKYTFKNAVLNSNEELCKMMINSGYRADKFIKSKAFSNIAQEGSLVKSKSKLLVNKIQYTRKILDSLESYNVLQEAIKSKNNSTKRNKI